MSKQSEARKEQGYRPAAAQQCGNCKAFTCRTELTKGWYGARTVEKDLRCTLGGFAVNKTAICNRWAPKVD